VEVTIVGDGLEQHGPHYYAVEGGSGNEQASFLLERVDGCSVVFAVGEIDLAASPVMRKVMSEAVESGRDLIVDLSAVSFLDSTGLYVLLGTQKTIVANHKSMSLAEPSSFVAKILRITRVEEAIPVYPNLDRALSATRAG
jgi:anti-sigma B factor antagonist